MIRYKAGIRMLLQVRHGSVFPSSMKRATVSALIAILVMFGARKDISLAKDMVMSFSYINVNIYAGFTGLLGFLIIFRTSIAYSRFWDGATFINQMNADWFEAASSLSAFCVGSTAGAVQVENFRQTLVRLFSMLHALALAELEAGGDTLSKESFRSMQKRNLNIIDPESLDHDSVDAMINSDQKVELVIHWIQNLVMSGIQTTVLSAPAPILSRAFQELSDGVVKFHNALTIAEVPFPFPYAQTNLALLVAHWFLVPLVMCGVTSQMDSDSPWLAGIFSFLQVFILWSLYSTAIELEGPFGDDANDLDLGAQQQQMNQRLLLLLSPEGNLVPQYKKLGVEQQSDESLAVRSPDDTLMLPMTGLFLAPRHDSVRDGPSPTTSERELFTLQIPPLTQQLTHPLHAATGELLAAGETLARKLRASTDNLDVVDSARRRSACSTQRTSGSDADELELQAERARQRQPKGEEALRFSMTPSGVETEARPMDQHPAVSSTSRPRSSTGDKDQQAEQRGSAALPVESEAMQGNSVGLHGSTQRMDMSAAIRTAQMALGAARTKDKAHVPNRSQAL